ncbi:quinon protein alcohol dehydrogenase-like superfamily [Rhypophila decipiens]|uniref:Quinon protein alcohol dehydrogenase-like superfamily n=1 Tax=Rhypophila decipiens TaxID=261697 RepID=A0AAN6Y9W5_9PEZI|nr:quinon protein alcohol dehydrogenase-like superfamily [Rhypophila decipiens]
MATVIPPPSKRQKRENLELSSTQQDVSEPTPDAGSFRARILDDAGEPIIDAVEIQFADASEKNLSTLVNTYLGREQDDFLPYRFDIHLPGKDTIVGVFPSSLLSLLQQHGVTAASETIITLSARPQAVFKVRIASRQLHKIRGHTQAILVCQWHPDTKIKRLATGSGDGTARIWDGDSGTPTHTLKGHTSWVLDVRWSPDGTKLATGSMDGTVRIWDPQTGAPIGKAMTGHRGWVCSVAWQPYHLWRDGEGPRLASAGGGKDDNTVRTWLVNSGRVDHVFSCESGVTCVKWGGTDFVYAASKDKTIRAWDAKAGTIVRHMKLHSHKVNHIALSTDYVLRTGFFDPRSQSPPATEEEKVKIARERFEKVAKKGDKVTELLASASEDFTAAVWDPINMQDKKPIARLQGHQKAVNHLAISPDGTLLATCGWDNHAKLWNAKDGKFLHTLRGHVGTVYQCYFSADSRMLVTSSKDTTLKIWDVRSGKMLKDLTGHEDEVWAVDLVGALVASGGKDTTVRIWT